MVDEVGSLLSGELEEAIRTAQPESALLVVAAGPQHVRLLLVLVKKLVSRV